MKKSRFFFLKLPLFFFLSIISVFYFFFVWEKYDVNKFQELPDFKYQISQEVKSNESNKKVVLFAICTISLAETSRALRVMEEFKDIHKDDIDSGRIEIHVLYYGGVKSFDYSYLLDNAGLPPNRLHLLQPEFESEEQIEYFYKIDRGEEFGDVFSFEELSERIKNELELYKLIKPNVIFTGAVLSTKLSAQIANIPLHVIVPLLYIDSNYYIDKIPYIGEVMKNVLKEIFSSKLLTNFLFKFLDMVWYQTKQFKRISLMYNVKPKIRSLKHIMEGDFTYISDIPEFTKIPENYIQQNIGKGYTYVGYLFAKINQENPEILENRMKEAQQKEEKILYFAMGSSGNSEIVKSILESLNKTFYDESANLSKLFGLVISPTKRLILKGNEKEGNEFIQSLHPKIMITDLINAPKIVKQADFGITHGGQGTIQTSLTNALPFVGIPSQVEQEMNIKGAEVLGSAIFVSKKEVLKNGGDLVIEKLQVLMENEVYVQKAKKIAKIVAKYDASKRIAKKLLL